VTWLSSLGRFMRAGNRYAREIGRTFGQLVNEKMALVAICRRCKHRRVLFPASYIARFGTNFPAIDRTARSLVLQQLSRPHGQPA
jgi:hypothetical protein